ncbi:MAG: hypothetical protein ACRDHD_12530 [Candidatus Limnocylindria bacterium]
MMMPLARNALVAATAAVILTACSGSAGEPISLTLETLSDSGVTGSVTLTPLSNEHTRVEIEVDPAGHPNMPAHIHPGTCEELVPQPRYPLQSVIGGRSMTEVPASLQELLTDTVALNLHASNAEMQIYTACVELR